MRNVQRLGVAGLVAVFLATGMAAGVRAQGPGTGGGRSNVVICTLLNSAYDALTAAGLADLAASAKEYAASIGCDWAE